MKPTLAIISSYNVTCGIAGYTAHLVKLLENDFEVTVLPIDLAVVTRSAKSANRHFAEIIVQAKQFDYVNIQFEPGLYGGAETSVKNLNMLLQHIKHPSVTLHTIAAQSYFTIVYFLKQLLSLRLKPAISQMLSDIIQQRYRKAYKILSLRQQEKYIPVFVHLKENADFLSSDYGLTDVYHHPLCYLNSDQQIEVIEQSTIEEFPRLHALGEDVTIVGVFGFLSEYKGFNLAIEAIRFLPEHYHLAIFGGLHPYQHVPMNGVPAYIKALQDSITDGVDISERVHFMGQPDDDTFLRAMSICDVLVFPYQETGQMSSGPLSMAVDLGKKVIASRTKAFRGYAEYNSRQIRFFDIGNVIELAQCIEDVDNNVEEIPPPNFTGETNRKHYVKHIVGNKTATGI